MMNNRELLIMALFGWPDPEKAKQMLEDFVCPARGCTEWENDCYECRRAWLLEEVDQNAHD